MQRGRFYCSRTARLRNNTSHTRSVTTRSDHPTQLGGGRAKPCRRVVLSGNTRPGRKPQRAHTHGHDRGKTPRARNTSCVTGSLLARVEGLEATRTPRPLTLSTPRPSPSNPQETPSDTLREPSETPPSGPMGPVSAEDGRSFEYRLELGAGEGCYVTPSRRPGVGRAV